MADDVLSGPPKKKGGRSLGIPEAAQHSSGPSNVHIHPESADATHATPQAPVLPDAPPAVDFAPAPMAADATATALPKPKQPEKSVAEQITAPADGTSVAPSGKPLTPATPEIPENKNTIAAARVAGGEYVRPAAAALEEAITTTVDIGAGVVNAFARDAMSAEWRAWFDNLKGEERHGLQLKKWSQELVGMKPEGIGGVAEDMLQLVGSTVAMGEVLKAPGFMGGAAGLLDDAAGAASAYTGVERNVLGSVAQNLKGKLGNLDKAGFVADFAFMDPLENNFLGLVDKSPDSQQNALTRALAADKDDPEVWNRLRNGLQGVFVGRALDMVVGTTRSLWLWRKAKKYAPGSAIRRSLENDLRLVLEAQGTVRVGPVTEAERIIGVDAQGSELTNRGRLIRNPGNAPLPKVDVEPMRNTGPIRFGQPQETTRGTIRGSKTLDEMKATGSAGGTPGILKTDSRPTSKFRAAAWEDDKGNVFEGINHADAADNAEAAGVNPETLTNDGFVTHEGVFVTREKALKMGQSSVSPEKGFPKAPEAAPADVVRNGDGTYGVTVNGKPTAETYPNAAQANGAAAASNRYFAAATHELQEVTSTIQQRIMRGTDPKDVAGLIDGTSFNFHWVSSADNAKAWINAVAEVSPYAHRIDKQSMEQTRQLALQIFGGESADEALSIAAKVMGNVENLPAQIWGLRAYQHATAKMVAELAEKVDLGVANALDADQLRTALGTLVVLNPQMRRIGTRVGQSLNAFKGDVPMDGIFHVLPDDEAARMAVGVKQAGVDPAKQLGPRAPANAGVFANFTKTDLMRVARHIRLSGGDPDVIDHYLRTVFGVEPPKPGSPMWMHFQALRYNSMLSGPLTHMKNIFSNFGLFAMKNAELAAFGLQTGTKEQFLQAWDQTAALWWHSAESFEQMSMAIKQGNSILDKEIQKDGLQEVLDVLASNPNATDSHWLSSLFHSPQVMLMGEDEFFKQLNYRASIRAQSLSEARRMFPNNPEKWAPHLQKMMDGAFSRSGGGINAEALDMARENTFTRDLVGGGKKASDAMGTLSFFFPFRRTPINIFLSASERTPGLWRISTTMREEMLGMHGSRRAAAAMAKLEMGKNLWMFSTGLAASGYLTGGGPRDKDQRNQKTATGWQPYSLKDPVTGKWVSIRAFEPLATILGVAGDAVEAFNDLSREARRKDQEELVGAFLLATASNVTNKSFMKGMLDMSNLFSGRESAGSMLLSSVGQQVIPFGSAISQMNTNPKLDDDLMREMNSVRERVLGRIPYFSENLEPVRSILGKPLPKESWVERTMWPLTISEEGGTKEQALVRELIKGVGENVRLPLPEIKLYDGLIDLQDRETFKPTSGKNQSPYDRMLELYSTGIRSHGVGQRNLPPVEDALSAVVNEDHAKLKEIFGVSGFLYGYWKSARPKSGVEISEADTRLGILRGVMKVYKDAAYAQVRKEYPELDKIEKKLDADKVGLKREQTHDRMKALPEYLKSATP